MTSLTDPHTYIYICIHMHLIPRSDRHGISKVFHCQHLAAGWRFCISIYLTENFVGDGLPLFDLVVFCNAAAAGLR